MIKSVISEPPPIPCKPCPRPSGHYRNPQGHQATHALCATPRQGPLGFRVPQSVSIAIWNHVEQGQTLFRAHQGAGPPRGVLSLPSTSGSTRLPEDWIIRASLTTIQPSVHGNSIRALPAALTADVITCTPKRAASEIAAVLPCLNSIFLTLVIIIA